MKWLSWIFVVAACVLVAVGLGFYKAQEIRAAQAAAAAFPEPVQAVEYYEVRAVERTPRLSVSGEIVATQSAELKTELKGRIVSVGFAPGARVADGQLLLQLDISQEEAQLAEAKAEQEIAQLALDRAQRLVTRGAGSVEARDQAKARFEASGARVRALQAVIDKKSLRAPFAGFAGLHELEVGQFIEAGTSVTRLIGASSQVWVDFALPQEHTHIVVGSFVSVLGPSFSNPKEATVVARDAAVNTRSRNLRLRAELKDLEPGELLPGMLVQVQLDLGAAQMATVVPATAVRRDAFGTSVYVLAEVNEGGQTRLRARKRPVTLGSVSDLDQSDDFAVVIEGLEIGERIAAIGAFKLRDGAAVVASAPDPDALSRVVGH